MCTTSAVFPGWSQLSLNFLASMHGEGSASDGVEDEGGEERTELVVAVAGAQASHWLLASVSTGTWWKRGVRHTRSIVLGLGIMAGNTWGMPSPSPWGLYRAVPGFKEGY